MSARADVRLPSSLARFASRRQVWLLLEKSLPRIVGVAGSIVSLEILNTNFKSYLKPSSSYKFCFSAVYRLVVRSDRGLTAGEQWIYLKAFVAGRSAAEYARHVSAGGAAPIHLAELDALVWRFPCTPGLPQLADFFTADGLRAMLIGQRVPARVCGPETTAVRVVNFRPEQRCTLYVQANTSGVPLGWYAKTYADDSGRETYLRMVHLAGLAEQGVIDLRIPRPHGYDAQRRTLWLEEVRAEPLEASLIGERWQSLFRGLGRGLAQLHRYAETAASAPEWTASLLLEELAHKSERLMAVYPLAARVLPALLQDLQHTQARLPVLPGAAIHGDFHIGQLLARSDQVVFCDFDELARGNPAHDLANFSVDLWLRGHARERISAIEVVVLGAYCPEAGCQIDPAQLHWYALIALANRAYRAYLQQPEDLAERVTRILEEIERVRGLLRRATGSSGVAEAA